MSGPAQGPGEPRQFARFAEGRPASEGYWPLPADGLCLSAFVLLSPSGIPTEVLMGRLSPDAPWDRIGALDPARVRNNTDGWMLPSCHLEYFEPPDEAARRILREQLGLGDVPLGPPRVYSESGPPRRHPGRARHWDIEFVYHGTVPTSAPPTHTAWRELRFLDPSRTPRPEFTRSHNEVLELAGYQIGPG
jgi:ADP-ribose pyrophosphatase YjhB (NUDIX family)